MAAHKYWRIIATEVHSSTYPTIANIEMLDAAGVNQCIDGIPSASSEYNSSHLVEYGFDANTGTRWSSSIEDRIGAWIQYEFPVPVDIRTLVIQAPITYFEGVPTGFNFLSSIDGITWEVEIAISNEVLWTASEIKSFFVGYVFNLESGSFPFNGYTVDFSNDGVFNLNCESGHFPYNLQEAYITWLNVQTETLAGKPIWHEGDYPQFEHVEGALPINRVPPHWGDSASPPARLVNKGLLGNVIRNDNPGIAKWRNPGIVAGSPLLYFFGCDVTPKEIVINEVLVGDYFVPIQIANNHLGQSIEIRSLQILNDPLNTMEITPQNWPRMLDPYSVATYTLKVSGTEGYPKIDSLLIVDAGTCYTEIPITGARNVECPTCPTCPPVIECPECPPFPDEEIDMAQCMIEQELCAISRGDTVPFNFRFTESGEPLKVTGMVLQMILKEDIKQVEPDMVKEVTFPDNVNSENGLGGLVLYPEDTMKLRAGVTYCFKYKLINGPLDISTIGRGTIPVNPDPHS